MARVKFLVVAIAFAWAATVYGSPTGTSIAINFAADEPAAAGGGYVEGAAGAAGTVNWNNLLGFDDVSDDIVMDVMGVPGDSGVEVTWYAATTWSSDGRGEDNNNAPPGNDYNLMLGYLDTTDVSVTEVDVSNLPAEISGGYDVLVYVLGGVLGRGGTYTVTAGDTEIIKENIQTSIFEGAYVEGSEGNYLLFEGLTGDSFRLEAMATTAALFRAPLNAIEICEPGGCVPGPAPVAGRGTIGDQALTSTIDNIVYAPTGDPVPGLAQEWVAQGNPGNKAAIDDLFLNNPPVVPAFQAGHGATWWTGSDAAFGDLVKYPAEVQPPLGADNNDNYVVRATGELLIPESGLYRFVDGVDDFTYFAVDLDGSGVAGDVAEEVLINDNTWTNTLRTGNAGGVGYAEVDIDVADGGEWLAVEFNMGEGGGGDSGVVYWDYNPEAPEGDRLNGAEGFPEIVEDPIDVGDAESMFIPDTHLRSVIQEVLSADLVASLPPSDLGFEFEIDADADTADRFVVANSIPDIYTTILDVDGVSFHLTATGDLQAGDSFQIIDANQITGVPVLVPADLWSFNPSTGRVTYGASLPGDYNGNGELDVEDLDLQAAAIMSGTDPPEFDLNGDGFVDYDGDRVMWLHELKGTWVGDADLDGLFDSNDFVTVFVAGTYENDTPAGWGEGDWNADGRFNTDDFVAAFVDGGYEAGAFPGAVQAVPEPSGIVMVLLGLAGLLGLTRRRS